MACDAGVPESMCYTSERKKEPVLGWFGEHKKLEKETHELRADSAEPEEEKKEENPELTAARQRKQRIAAALNKPRTDELRRRFWEYDMNSDGKLDIDEVKRLLRAGKPTMSNGDIEAIFKRVDKNGDSRISFNELVSWVFSADGPSGEESDRLFRRSGQ